MFSFRFHNKKYEDKKLNESLFDILNNNKLLSIATINSKKESYINTAYYSFDEKLKLYIITNPKSNHSINLSKNYSVAVSIFDSHLKFWEDKLQGVQLFGKGYKTPISQLPKGTSCFIKRFPPFKEIVKNPKDFMKKSVTVMLYTLEISRIKLFDEKRFGEENFIELKLR